MRIDNLGTIYNDEDNLIGYYEPSTKECFDLDDQPMDCPSLDSIPKDIVPTSTVSAKRTYWGLLILVLVLVGIAFLLWKLGKKNT